MAKIIPLWVMYEIRSYSVVTRDATMVGGKLTFLGFEGAILAENAFPRNSVIG